MLRLYSISCNVRRPNYLDVFFIALLICSVCVNVVNAIPNLNNFQKITLSGRGIGYSSPTIAEIDGDLSNGKEITVVGSDAILYVYHNNGTLLWKKSLPSSSCTTSSPIDKAYSSPAVGALRGDEVPYIVVGYGGFQSASCDGGVIALQGSDGAMYWNFSIKDFSREQKFFAFRNTVFSTPSLADVDGDGLLEVGFGSFDRNIYLLNSNGTVRWYYHAADTVWSSPSFLNIDSDPNLEMVIGADITSNKSLSKQTRDGGFVYAFKTSAVTGKFVDFQDPEKKIMLWQRFSPQVVYASPSIGELLPNSPGDEIIIGTGCYFPENSTKKRSPEFRILEPVTGKVLSRIRTPICAASSAAIADLNADGQNEVVISIAAQKQWGGNGKGKLIAYSPVTGAKIWQANLRAMFPLQSPLIADLDLDGDNEVLITESIGLVIVDGATGETIERYRLPGLSQSSPAVADIDNNGTIDIVATGGKGGKGEIYIWRDVSGVESRESRRSLSEALVWPQWRVSPKREGAVRGP